MLCWQTQLSKRCVCAACCGTADSQLLGDEVKLQGATLGVAIVFTLRSTVWIVLSGSYAVCLYASAVSLCVYELLVCPAAVVDGGGQSSR